MQLPITIGLHRSFFLGAALTVAHILAVVPVLMAPWQSPVKVSVLAGVGIAGLLSLRCWFSQVKSLRLLGDGRIECQLAVSGGKFLPADLLPAAVVHPWLTVVRLNLEEGRVMAVVLPDSTTADEFRRLRLWLRWRAEFSNGKGAA